MVVAVLKVAVEIIAPSVRSAASGVLGRCSICFSSWPRIVPAATIAATVSIPIFLNSMP